MERHATHYTRGWVGPRASRDGCGKPCPNRIRSLDRPSLSELLYRLSCPGRNILQSLSECYMEIIERNTRKISFIHFGKGFFLIMLRRSEHACTVESALSSLTLDANTRSAEWGTHCSKTVSSVNEDTCQWHTEHPRQDIVSPVTAGSESKSACRIA
jgi:hypothetical protein